MNYLAARFKEPSTWFAIFAVALAFLGNQLEPEQKEALQMLSVALFGGGLMVSKG